MREMEKVVIGIAWPTLALAGKTPQNACCYFLFVCVVFNGTSAQKAISVKNR